MVLVQPSCVMGYNFTVSTRLKPKCWQKIYQIYRWNSWVILYIAFVFSAYDVLIHPTLRSHCQVLSCTVLLLLRYKALTMISVLFRTPLTKKWRRRTMYPMKEDHFLHIGILMEWILEDKEKFRIQNGFHEVNSGILSRTNAYEPYPPSSAEEKEISLWAVDLLLKACEFVFNFLFYFFFFLHILIIRKWILKWIDFFFI